MAIQARQLKRDAVGVRGEAGPAPATARPVQLVAFVAAGVECALPVELVREIIEVGVPRPHPAAAGDLRGALALPAGPVALLDLGSRLGHGETAITRLACALILERPFGDDLPLALLVEGVRDLVDVPRTDLAPAPRFGGAPGAFGAVARLPGRLLPVLDLGRLLTADDAVRAEAISTPNAAPQEPGARPSTH